MDRFGNVLLCDQIYNDRTSNKVVLAGVYSGSINVASAPAAFNAAIYSEYWTDTLGHKEIDFQVLFEGELQGGAKISVEIVDAESPALLIVPGYQFSVTGPGVLKIQAVLRDGSVLPMISKRVEVGTATA